MRKSGREQERKSKHKREREREREREKKRSTDVTHFLFLKSSGKKMCVIYCVHNCPVTSTVMRHVVNTRLY